MSLEAELGQRSDTLRTTLGWRSYQEAREHVIAMKDRQAALAQDAGAPSAYWREELCGFEYLWDASPLLVDRLRHHSYHVTGLKVYDYRSNRDESRARFASKLDRLCEVAGGDDLLVCEPDILGGFGFDIGGRCLNLDTLKFFEALIALDRGGVLGSFRDPAVRRIVWEIGAGWGGFAYAFKTLFPNTTYVITDLPELFLFSATYLQTAFPDARFVFGDSDDLEAALADAADADFVFLPNDRLDETLLPRLDLTINMVSFQEMTDSQVRAYVAHAHRLRSPYLYSLNRDRSGYNRELSSVSEILSERFWPHEIPVMPESYTKLQAPKARAVKRNQHKRPLDYRHIVGWLRQPT